MFRIILAALNAVCIPGKPKLICTIKTSFELVFLILACFCIYGFRSPKLRSDDRRGAPIAEVRNRPIGAHHASGRTMPSCKCK